MSNQPRETESARISFVDSARGVAVILMVLTHAVNALLASDYRIGWMYDVLSFAAGSAAPLFLFLSGVTLHIVCTRQNDKRRDAVSPNHKRTITRLAWLLLIGYWLQVPILSLRQLIWNARDFELTRMFDTNILQIIAVASLLVVGVYYLCTRVAVRTALLFSVGIAVVIATPFVLEGQLFMSVPAPVRAYLMPQPMATFGAFPFAGYLILGSACGRWILTDLQTISGKWRVLGASLSLIVAAYGLDTLVSRTWPHHNFWWTSSQHVLLRLGSVLAVVALCSSIRGPVVRILRSIGRRSLGIYLVHLVLIYGSPVSAGIAKFYANALSPISVALLATSALLMAFGASVLWEWIGTRNQRIRDGLRNLAWIIFLSVFLSNP